MKAKYGIVISVINQDTIKVAKAFSLTGGRTAELYKLYEAEQFATDIDIDDLPESFTVPNHLLLYHLQSQLTAAKYETT